MEMLTAGWRAAPAAPDAPLADRAGLAWRPIEVPVWAGALAGHGVEPAALETVDWWFETEFSAPPSRSDEEVLLHLGGLATVAEAYLNDKLVLESDSMFAEHAVEVGARLQGQNRLAIRCRALAPLLAVPRRPRARWRTRLVEDGAIRWYRTMLLGRMPGRAPGPPLVGPWRPVALERRRGTVLDGLHLATGLRGADGVLSVVARTRGVRGVTPSPVRAELRGPNGRHILPLHPGPDGTARAEMRVPNVERWWPHTHGGPALHEVRIVAHDGASLATAGVGFRSLAAGASPGHDLERDGIDLHLNGERVFCRGAIWVPGEARGATSEASLRADLERVAAAGMNMLRVPGFAAYESERFHALCDELGILVWQDLMFANLDYPFGDEAFRAAAEAEAAGRLARLTPHPSTAVVCGNSEVEQQAAMQGLEPGIGRDAFFAETLPSLAAAAGTDAICVPSAPFGGALPFRNDHGVAHYFGVGGYRRPLADARLAGVRFAAASLAIANVPDAATLTKAGVPHDPGSEWDFDDVRDHYLAALYGVDPAALREADPPRYLALSRQVSGEVMAEAYGEWRRAASPTGGALVLWLRDLVAGAGWGLLDHDGAPKVAYHHMRRALAPVAAWTTDEGLDGIAIHLANDTGAPLSAVLRVALYHDLEHQVAEASAPVSLPPRTTVARDLEAVVGYFLDASYAYRFGPPAHDAVVVTLEHPDEPDWPLAQAFRFPAGYPIRPEPAAALGIEARTLATTGGKPVVVVRSRRLAYGVRLALPGHEAADDAFSVEPGHARVIPLRAVLPGARLAGGTLTALNLDGSVELG